MESFHVQKINDHLVLSMNSLPGFGKLCAVEVYSKGEIIPVPVYYTGSFFKRPFEAIEEAQVIEAIRNMVRNYAIRRDIVGHAKAIKFTSCAGNQRITFNCSRHKATCSNEH